MSSKNQLYIYLALLAFTFLFSLYRNKTCEQELKIISILLGLTLLSESIAHWAAVHLHNNNFVYHIFAPLQLFIIALFYQQALPPFGRYKLGWVIGSTGIIIAVLNAIFFQPLKVLNTYFLLFEGLLVIAIALYSFLALLKDKTERPFFRVPLFWVSTALLFFWCSDFMGLILIKMLQIRKMQQQLHVVYMWTWIVNIFTYSLLGSLFILPFKNKQK